MKGINRSKDRLLVEYEHEGRSRTIQAERVVNGAEHVANVDALNLDAANAKHNGLRIETDPFLRSTTNPAVWVTGDALTTSPQLSPIATHEGRVVGRNIVDGPSLARDYAVIPSVVHTVPALATLGIKEEAAIAEGLNVKVSTGGMTGWFSAKSYAEAVARAKVLVDQDTDRIVRAHMVGHRADELIHLLSMAIRHDVPASAIKEDMLACPTFSSDVKKICFDHAERQPNLSLQPGGHLRQCRLGVSTRVRSVQRTRFPRPCRHLLSASNNVRT